MCKKIWAFVFGFVSIGYSFAQDINLPNNYSKGSKLNVLYRNEISGQFFIHNRGFGMLIHQGRHITTASRSFYEIGFNTLKHQKEVKSTGIGNERKRFVYGKLNNLMVLNLSLGMQKILFAKADEKAVEVRYSYSLGPLLTLAKPYYIRAYKNYKAGSQNQETNTTFDDEKLSSDSSKVLGHAAFGIGMNDIKFYPGINAKFNLSFEYAPYTNLVRAIETGISLDYYPKALPIMARNSSENFVLTLKVGFIFGTRWN